MVLIVKGKIAPLAIPLLLPEAVKHFQFFRKIRRISGGICAVNEAQNKTTEPFPPDAGREDFSTKSTGAYRFDAPRRKMPHSQ